MNPVIAPAAGRPMTLNDLFQFKRVADPQISPDGQWIIYAVTTVDLAANKTSSNLWLAPAAGGEPRQLTATDKKDRHPRWSPDSKKVLFESTRSGDSQLWVIDTGGGEARQLTHISTEASNGLWSRDGKQIAFVSAVYPEFSEQPFKDSDAANKKKIDDIQKSPVKAKVFKRLFYRHWDSWVEDKRQHLFVVSAEGGEPRDVTPGDRDAYPTSTTFSTGDDYTFSPDGKFLVFTAVPAKDEAWTTNYDICRVSITNTSPKWETLTNNPAADGGPIFSPDGKKLAYRAQKKAGYEADKWDLMVVDCDAGGKFSGTPKNLTEKLDRSIDDYVWAVDKATMFFTAEENASKPVWEIHAGSGEFSKLVTGGTNGSLSISDNGERLAFSNAALSHPPRACTIATLRSSTGTPRIFDPNAKFLAELNLPRPESVTVPVEGGTMQMWILKPADFDPARKWPVAFLVHGGPQGAWEDGWSYRWCPEVWAAQGYVVALPNPRGSTGFGQKFVDEITGDWGGKCYDDLMKALDHVVAEPYVDKDRIGAAGASFGGYMMDWFAVNTDRFKCLITHCSVWNFDSMYATTDEIWFDEWEHGGPPWGKNRESYEKHSPHRKAANLGKYKTPMLVIHNDLDFRCPLGQGQELFTALQRQGVKSKFINFPDEGHWVLKPANSEFWHKEVFAWLKEHVPPGGK